MALKMKVGEGGRVRSIWDTPGNRLSLPRRFASSRQMSFRARHGRGFPWAWCDADRSHLRSWPRPLSKDHRECHIHAIDSHIPAIMEKWCCTMQWTF